MTSSRLQSWWVEDWELDILSICFPCHHRASHAEKWDEEAKKSGPPWVSLMVLKLKWKEKSCQTKMEAWCFWSFPLWQESKSSLYKEDAFDKPASDACITFSWKSIKKSYCIFTSIFSYTGILFYLLLCLQCLKPCWLN